MLSIGCSLQSNIVLSYSLPGSVCFGLINFREYAKITSLIKSHLEWKDIPDYRVPRSKSSFPNILLSIDLNGVSDLYRMLQNKGNHILGELDNNRITKADLSFRTIKL